MPTAAPEARTLSRDDIVRMGQSGANGRGGEPWGFLPVAVQALRQMPGDFGLRLITAANFVRLGLKTGAADHLALLPDQIVSSPEVEGLARLIRGMPSDIVETSRRIATAKANLVALGARAPAVDFDAWARAARDTVFCRAIDGNIVCRPAATASPAEAWRTLSDQRRSAARIIREHFQPSSEDSARPVYIEGIDPPWLLIELSQARLREPTGYLAPITLLQAEEGQFLDGLSIVDLSATLSAGNISALVGPDAAARLADHLRARSSFQISGAGLTTTSTRIRCNPSMSEVLAAATTHQETLMTDLTRRAAEAYPARDPSWWRARFERAGTEPLRILIPTTRYSTFVQHASRDLARAFEALGHEARILIEPDDSTKFAATAYLTEILAFRPDLLININYPRAMLEDAVPREVPFVCWVQDAMPHLFSPTIGAAQTGLDFIVGHLFDELFDRHNYPRSRAMSAAIVADDTKFHAGPCPHAGDSQRFTCDLAYVSHQSETPDAQHARLRAEFSANLPIAQSLDRLKPFLEREANKPLSDLRTIELRDLTATVLKEELRREPDARIIDIVTRSYCYPHIDRLIRHQTLAWAADIADRRGWTFKLYGKGWETHARLARYAAGPLDHGDDLRRSYHSAAVHLHVMAHALVHQRLIECILSGGFPLCRLHAPERWAITETLCRRGVREGAPPLDLDDPVIPSRRRVASWADAPALMHMASALQRLGLLNDIIAPTQGARRGPLIDEREWLDPGSLPPHDPDLWSAFLLLGSSEHFMFHSPQTLEARIDFALNRPDQRAVLSAAAGRRFRERFTYSALAARLLAFLRDHLGTSP